MIRVVDSQIRPGELWHVYDDLAWLGAIDSVFSPIGKLQIAIGGGPRSNELYDSREDALNAFKAHVVAEKKICQIHDRVRGYVLLDSWYLPYQEFRGGTDQSRWTYYPTFEAAYEALLTKLVAEKLEAT